MEEKEIIFKINKTNDYLEVTTSTDEDVDYVTKEEAVGIILTTVDYVVKKIAKNIVIDNCNEKVDEITKDKIIDMSEKVNFETMEFIGILVHQLLNFVHNKAIEEEREFDYSLVVYKTEDNKKNIYETLHHSNVSIDDKFLACFTFYKDIIKDLMLDKANNKNKIKDILHNSFSSIQVKLDQYIDDKFNSNSN